MAALFVAEKKKKKKNSSLSSSSLSSPSSSSSLPPFADPQHLHLENQRLPLVVGELPPRSERRGLRAESFAGPFFRLRVPCRGGHKRAALGARAGAGEGGVEPRDEVSGSLMFFFSFRFLKLKREGKKRLRKKRKKRTKQQQQKQQQKTLSLLLPRPPLSVPRARRRAGTRRPRR